MTCLCGREIEPGERQMCRACRRALNSARVGTTLEQWMYWLSLKVLARNRQN
jgi:hypothetical protein